jgi:hypothetical protein
MPTLKDLSTAADNDTDPVLYNEGRRMPPRFMIEPGQGGTITELNNYDVLCGDTSSNSIITGMMNIITTILEI